MHITTKIKDHEINPENDHIEEILNALSAEETEKQTINKNR